MNQMKRAICLAAAVLLLWSMPIARAEAFPYVAYATDAVRLRGGPSSTAEILAVIRQGDAVMVTGSDGNYKIVEYEGRKGYVVSAFLSSAQASAQTPNQTGETVTKEAAAYRTAASGDSGTVVKAIQEALKELGFYTKSIDSKYGSGTAQAVKDFQEKNKLPASGIADQNTQYLLFEGKPRNIRGNETDVKTLPPISGYTIRPGDRGDAVIEVQQTLTQLKYYSGAIDGDYGSGTQTAVKAFQKDNKLTSDGVIGSKTFAALALAVKPGAGPVASAAPEAVPQDTPQPTFTEPGLPEASYPYTTTAAASVNMRKRASASAMRILTIPQGASLQVLEDTGNYLKVTYRNYTGFVAKDFINIPEQYLDGKSLAINQDARLNYQTLAPGAEGKAVRALQHALAELGYYSGSIDGKFGSGTTASLKAFQDKNGLRATGVALPELQQLLYEKRVRNSKNKLVFTKTLPPIEGVTLREGDYGDAVYELNTMLLKTGHFDSNVGYEFTRATAQAVRAFQKEHKIKVTGRVDFFTMLALKTQIQANEKTTTPPVVTVEPLTQDNVVVIREGTKGVAVTRLQERLVALKYYAISPDGVFNSDDAAAVRHFQRLNSLPVTGIADLATQQTLYTPSAIAADASVLQGATPSTGVLRIGSYGDAVKAMQSRLVALKYLSGSVDGIFGTQTAAAVSTFQKANNLKQDGIAGSQTLTALYGASAVANKPATQPGPQPTGTTGTSQSLNVGSKGPEVISLQNRLIELKYLAGSADGIYGPRTFLAVKEFQGRNNLESDGIAGKLTLARLASSNAVAKAVINIPTPSIPLPTPPPVTPTFTAPKANEVILANWYTTIRPVASRLRNVVIYDFISGKHYNFRFYSLGKHADGTTLTTEDTAVMNSVLGANNWTPRPVWVIFSDGRVYMGSTHSHPHEVDYIPDNGLNGHLCVHFPREMEEAALTGPYAVSHQQAIQAGWDITQNMAK